MEQVIQFLSEIKFVPSYGDWSSALATLLVGIFSFSLTTISFLFVLFKWKKESKETKKQQIRAIEADEFQNFIELSKYYDTLWDKVASYGNHVLHSNYKDTKKLKEILGTQEDVDKLKTSVFQVIKLLSNVEFGYCNKQNTIYWKRWHYIYKFVFKHKFIYTAFIHNKENFEQSNLSFVEYIDNMMKEDKEEKKAKKEKEAEDCSLKPKQYANIEAY